MKWVVLVVLAIPLIGHAEEPTNKALNIGLQGYHDLFPSTLKGWGFPAASLFTLEAQQSLENVTVHLTFFVEDSPDFSVDQLQAARCGVVTPETARGLPRTFPPLEVAKALGDTWELWVPSLKEGAFMGVMIGWRDPDLAIHAVTMTVTSDQMIQQHHWKKEDLKKIKKTVQPYLWTALNPALRTIPLNHVCEEFTPFQMPQTYIMARQYKQKTRAGLDRKRFDFRIPLRRRKNCLTMCRF